MKDGEAVDLGERSPRFGRDIAGMDGAVPMFGLTVELEVALALPLSHAFATDEGVMRDELPQDDFGEAEREARRAALRRSRLWVSAVIGALGLAIAAASILRVAAFDRRVAAVLLILGLAAMGWSGRQIVRFFSRARG